MKTNLDRLSMTTGLSAVLGSSLMQSALDKTASVSRDAAQAVSALLTPLAVIALVFGMWRFGTDIGWTEDFVISNGLFSHWQIWIALSIALQALASVLYRTADVVRQEDSYEAHLNS